MAKRVPSQSRVGWVLSLVWDSLRSRFHWLVCRLFDAIKGRLESGGEANQIKPEANQIKRPLDMSSIELTSDLLSGYDLGKMGSVGENQRLENAKAQRVTGNKEKERERDVAIEAQTEHEKENYEATLRLLQSLGVESKAVEYNRLITQFAIDGDTETLLNGLITSEDLDLDQQVLIDYNRALALAKYRERYDESIDLLEQRMSILSENFGLIDERLSVKLCLLLAVLYMERKKDPKKALPLLNFISEKCDSNALPPRLQQLKAKCFLQMGSTKLAKRELKSISGEPLLRSYLELQRNNLKKAMKIYSSCSPETVFYNNNEALIQYGLGKRNTSVFLMGKTVKTASPEMLYNLAIMHLFTGNTKNAFDILYNLVPHYKSNPRLWLRLAECCLEDRCKSTVNDFDLGKHKQELVKGYVGTGIHRKLLLNGSSDRVTDRDTLLFARGCLMNSLTIINSPECSFYPSNPPSDTELTKLRISICLCLAYVNLSLSDYVLAYRYAKGALNLSPSSYQAVLANLYAGEALIWLDQISEAITHFTPDLLGHEPLTGEETTQTPLPPSVSSWFPATAKIVLLYNMAVAYTLRGELDKASETLRQVGNNVTVPDAVVPVNVIMLAIYIQLQQGYIDIAKEMIRKHLPQYR